MELYEKGAVPSMAPPGPEGPRVLQMGFRDGTLDAMGSSVEIKSMFKTIKQDYKVPAMCQKNCLELIIDSVT